MIEDSENVFLKTLGYSLQSHFTKPYMYIFKNKTKQLVRVHFKIKWVIRNWTVISNCVVSGVVIILGKMKKNNISRRGFIIVAKLMTYKFW